jgi:hypothetical protein
MNTTLTLSSPKRRGTLAALALIATLVPAAHAQNMSSRNSAFDWNTDGRLIDVSVLVDGSTAPLYAKSGVWDRHYFQAFKGRNYSLVLRNNTSHRVGVLIAVDGLNVVNGDRSALRSNEPMYVLDAYETATIRGWRTSLDDVRRFVFVDEERSYAERTGQANGDMGWIRVLSFNEQRPLAWRDWDWNRAQPYEREDKARDGAGESRNGNEPRAQAAPAPTKDGVEGSKQRAMGELNGTPDSNPGTGWGEQRRDPVQQTQFLAERTATDRITLRYEYASGLRALGITPRRDLNRTWERDHGQLGFAEAPRW